MATGREETPRNSLSYLAFRDCLTGSLTNSSNQTTGGADNYTGTANDDTFLAVADGAFDNGDVINGGAGTDTLSTRYSLNGPKTVNGAVTNVETIKIDLDDGKTGTAETLTFSTSGMTGLQNVTIIDASSTSNTEDIVNVTNLAAGVGVGITNGDANWKADFDLSDVTGTADAITLSLTAAKADLVTIAGVETVTVNAVSGTSTLDDLTIAAATKMVITGAGKLTVSALTGDTLLATVDASAATGNISIVGFIAGDVSVAGGSGDDTFDFTTNGVGTADTVTGGAGTDRLVVAASQTTALTKATLIEELGLTVAAATVDYELSGKVITSATNFVVNVTATNDGAANEVTTTISNLGDASTVTVDAASSKTGDVDGTGLTITHATDTTTNAVTVAFSGIGANTAALANTGISVVTINTTETIALQANKNEGGTVTTNGVEVLNATAAKAITVTGAADLTIASIVNLTALTSLDASAATGKFTISGLDASALSFKGAVGANTIDMAGLNATDTIVGGAATTDALTATGVSGLTATTGKLNVTGFETVKLQTATTNTIDASLMTGLSTLSISGAATDSITNLAAGVKVGLGDTTATNTGTLTVALADATGTADALTVSVINTAATTTSNTLKVSSVETLTLAVSANANAAALVLDNAKATTINVTGGLVGTALDLNNAALATTVTKFDSSAFLGNVLVDRSTGTAAATVLLAGSSTTANTYVGATAAADTVTVGTSSTYAKDATTATGGTAQADALTLYVDSTFASFANIGTFEDITVNVKAGDDVAVTDATGLNDAELNNLTITGGNALSTFADNAATTIGVATTDMIDASGFSGNIDIELAAAAIVAGATVTIKGGALDTDIVSVTTANAATYTFNTTGIETIAVLEATGASTIDFANAVGVTLLAIDSDKALTLNNLAVGVVVQAGLDAVGAAQLAADAGVDVATLDINYASTSGAADSMTLNLAETTGAAVFDIDGIETLNIAAVKDDADAWDTAHGISLAGSVNATNKIAVVMTGGNSTSTITFATSGLVADVTSVNASALDSAVVISAAARMNSSAMTITGGTAGDTIAMENTADVLDGGSDAGDTLNIVQNAVLGGFQIDLSSTTDQVTTYNGSANAAVQKGFRSVDASGITGVFGSDITAISTGSTITGTSNNDVITGGDGADIIVATAGNDAITGGAGTNTYRFDTAALFEARSATTASYAGGAGTDTLAVMAASTAGIDTDLANLTSVEQLLLTGASSIVLGSNAATAGLTTVITGAGNTGVDGTVNADTTVVATALANTAALALSDSANITNFTVTGLVGNITTSTLNGTLNVTTAATGGDGTISIAAGAGNVVVTGGLATDTISVTGLATASQTFTGTVAKFNVTGSTNAQTITTGTAADTVNGGAGADIIVITAGGNDVVRIAAGEEGDAVTGFTAGAAADVLDISYALVSNNNTAADLADFAATKAVAANNFLDNMTSLTIASSAGYAAGTSVILEIGSALGVLSALTTANFRSVFGVGGSAGALTVGTSNQGKFLVVAYNGTTAAADAALFLVDYSTDGTVQATIHASDTVTLVGTFAGVGSNALTADNFL